MNSELPSLAVEAAASAIEGGALVLDVRSRNEYHAGHIAGALNIPYGLLPQQSDRLPAERPILLHCASATRAQIAASLLMMRGFQNFTILAGGFDAWKAAGLPTTTS